jgi:hypothetical protein
VVDRDAAKMGNDKNYQGKFKTHRTPSHKTLSRQFFREREKCLTCWANVPVNGSWQSVENKTRIGVMTVEVARSELRVYA